MRLQIQLCLATAAALAGCATPSWHNPAFPDPVAAKRQFTIDDGYCTMVASGTVPAVPMPPPPQTSTTSNVALRVTSTNSATGVTTWHNYQGQVSTAPVGGFGNGFASGFANGMATGAAFAAMNAQEKIHKSCMYSKGWFDGPTPVQATAIASAALKPLAVRAIYETPAIEWQADSDEFLALYPAYSMQPYFDKLNERVKAIAKSMPQLTGPQILLKARDDLMKAGQAPAEPDTSKNVPHISYADAVAGKPLDQAALGLFYTKGSDTIQPNPKRSAYWTQKAAAAGHPIGRMGYGILLFSGIGVTKDRVEGYRWVQASAQQDASANEVLVKFGAELTPAERAQLK